MSNIAHQIKLAKKSLIKHKKAIPHIFPEWQYMMECKRLKKIANADYKQAKKTWNKLGN